MARTKKCGKGCGRDAATGNGRAGAARVAGLCYPCWKAASANGNGDGHEPPPLIRATGPRGPVVRAFGELEHLMKDLGEIAGGLVSDSAELLERSRRFAHEVRARVVGARGMAGTIEKRVREANAELRREVKLGLLLRNELRAATKALPAVQHERNEAAGGE